VAQRAVHFTKAHGLGNDFLLVEADAVSDLPPDLLARQICDRHTGVGADGLVVLGPSASADATFRIYNSDGSEATLSGNAVRCAAALLISRCNASGRVAPARIKLDTRVGLRTLHFLERRGAEWIFRTEIGKPGFAALGVPFRPPAPPREPIVDFPLPVGDAILPVTVLSMGNPQCILILPLDSELDWIAVGAEIERHPFFPNRTNVGFVRVMGTDAIEARFWERGAGHTLASGTGSCACAVAAHLAGKVGRRTTVHLERGSLDVHWRDDDMVELRGPAEIVAEGEFFWQEGKLTTGSKGPR
jgi:diaminopimelate epimerase